MRFLLVVLAVLGVRVAAAQVPLPTPAAQRKAPAGMEGLVWNKWDTRHFSVLSIDKSEGREIKSFIECDRDEVLAKWSLPPSKGFYCKMVCVRDPDMLKKMFGIDDPRCEVRRKSDGSPELAAIWLDSERIHLLPSLLLEAELSFGDLPLYIQRGLTSLEKSSDHLKSFLPSASESPCSSMLDQKRSEASFKANPHSFDADSAILCLMVRKEFGPLRFGEFVRSRGGVASSVLGFPSQKDLDDTYSRYRKNLIQDLKDGRTPDHYLHPGR